MILVGFRDNFPAQENGHYLIPEKKKYGQLLRVLYSVTNMTPVKLELGFLDTDLDNNRVKTSWCLLTEPSITVEEFMYGVGAVLKSLEDKEIPVSYTTLLFGLKPNRPELVSSLDIINKTHSKLEPYKATIK